jgi:phosphoribosyl 1,2-cyclic phosphodiesterase
MLFSHSHWDHIQGFPFFTPAYVAGNTFYVYSPRSGDTQMYDLLSGQMRSEYFPVNFRDLGANIVASDLADSSRVIEGVEVSFLMQNHPGGSYAFKFEYDGIKVVYATDTELDAVLENREESMNDYDALRIVPQEYIDFAQDAHLLICDSQFFDDEYVEKVGWGHPRANTAVDWAVQSKVKHLSLFHHDPMHSDKEVEEKVATCRDRAEGHGAEIVISGAREGLEFRVSDEEEI